MRFRRDRTYRLFPQTKTSAINITTALIMIASTLGGALPVLANQTAAALTNASNVYIKQGGTGDCSSTVNACGTFVAALSAVANNGTIHVAAGHYAEAVSITKSVNIVGAATGTTFIDAPSGLPAEGSIVDISGSTVSASISKLTVEGPGPSGCGSIWAGVYVENDAFANLHNMAVNDVRDTPLSGCQNGRAILVGWGHGWGVPNTTGSATVNDVTMTDYQKAGVEVSGASSSATIENNTITGVGSTNAIAANGVEVTYGATANVHDNTITNNEYTGADFATGILLYQSAATTSVKSNTVSGNQIGLWTEDQGSLAHINTVGNTGNGRNAVADTTGWSSPSTVYADSSATGTTNGDGSDIVMTQGQAHVWAYDVFATIQDALNAVPTNGTVKVANGTYNENLNILRSGVHLTGESEAGVHINGVSGNYGVDIERQNGTHLTGLTFDSASGNTYALHAYGVNGLTFTNVAFNGPGKSVSTGGGLDVNSSQNVGYNNVSVNNYHKNGFSVTAQYLSTDAYSRNITFNGITADGNGWDGIAFYDTNSGGTVGHSIPGVQFKGTNTVSNNGSGANVTQGGIFFEGDSDGAFACTFLGGGCTPHYTVTGNGNTPVELGTTAFSGNSEDVVNYQTKGVTAGSATFNGLTGDQMSTAQRNTEDNLIFDQLDRANLGLVKYYNVPTVPTNGQPNGGFEKTNDFYFTWDAASGNGPLTYEFQASMNPASSNGVLTTGVWDNIASGNSEQKNLTSPQIHSVGAPDGTWYWQVRTIDSDGNKSDWSSIWSVTIDTQAPSGLANVSPADGTHTTTTGLAQITWHAATDPNGPVVYYYESSNNGTTNLDGSFTSPVYQSGALSTNNIPTTGTPAGTYYWHVRAVDAAGNSTGWTGPWRVVVDNTAPTQPIASPGAGTYTSVQLVSLNSTDDSGDTPAIYYTTDGSTPSNSNGTLYTGAFTINVSETVKAIAYDASGNTSTVLTAVYSINLPKATTLFFGNAGTGNGNQGQNNGNHNGPLNFFAPQILGATTNLGNNTNSNNTNSAGNGNNGNNGHVKGDSTVKVQNVSNNSHSSSFAWWWLAVPAVIVAMWLAFAFKRRKHE